MSRAFASSNSVVRDSKADADASSQRFFADVGAVASAVDAAFARTASF
jgi:hypothetical protein